MRKAKLEILGIEAPLNLFDMYSDDGFVKNIVEHTRELNLKYGRPLNLGTVPARDSLGRYVAYEKRFEISLFVFCFGKRRHIFYLDQGWEPLNVQNRAHEETHVLDDLGRLDILSDKMLAEQNVKLNVWDYDSEVAAELGSLYAIAKRKDYFKIDFIACPEALMGYLPSSKFEEALEIYKNAQSNPVKIQVPCQRL